MSDQGFNGNGIRNGIEKLLVYWIGAAGTGIVIALIAVIQQLSSLSSANAAQAAAVNSIQMNVSSLSAEYGNLSGQFTQYVRDHGGPHQPNNQ